MEKDNHCMDKTAAPGMEVELNEDLTRELLIAISYTAPDTDLTAELSPKNIAGEKVVEPLTCDAEEKYRSKLISISYSPSPEVKVLPLLPRQL